MRHEELLRQKQEEERLAELVRQQEAELAHQKEVERQAELAR